MAEQPTDWAIAQAFRGAKTHLDPVLIMRVSEFIAAIEDRASLLQGIAEPEEFRKAAMYDWLIAGGIYRLGYDNVGGPSLDRWDEVIPMLMQSCAGPNCTGHPHSDECRAEYARCLELGGDE